MAESKQRIHNDPALNVEFENIYRAFNQLIARIKALETGQTTNTGSITTIDASIVTINASLATLSAEIAAVDDRVTSYHP